MASRPTRQRLNPAQIERRCVTQKVAFGSAEEAWTASERMMEANRVKPGCHIVPYVCLTCGAWHLANKVIVPLGRRRKLLRTKGASDVH